MSKDMTSIYVILYTYIKKNQIVKGPSDSLYTELYRNKIDGYLVNNSRNPTS